MQQGYQTHSTLLSAQSKAVTARALFPSDCGRRTAVDHKIGNNGGISKSLQDSGKNSQVADVNYLF
jgi:hypothetical protein